MRIDDLVFVLEGGCDEDEDKEMDEDGKVYKDILRTVHAQITPSWTLYCTYIHI